MTPGDHPAAQHRRPLAGRRGRRLALAVASAVVLLGAIAAASLAGPAAHRDAMPPGGPAEPGPRPFDLPPPADLRAGPHQVFAHYFPPYPLSLDNQPAERDYYARNYLTPDGEHGKHAAYGGLLRDRPPPVAPTTGDWQLANLEREVRTAREAGIDGFSVDILSLKGPNWERARTLLRAAHADGHGFRIMLMPDMTSLRTDPDTLADALAVLAAEPAAHRLADGRLVVSPFKAEEQRPDWWARMADALARRHDVRTALVPLFLDFASHAREFAPVSAGFSAWGSRSYTGQDGTADDIRLAHSLGKLWMQPVSVQDARPSQGVYDEAGNTRTLRTTWGHAIDDGADWVQLTTWNDYSESSHFAPSAHNGSVYLDLSSYYLARFKTGRWPRIVRDTLYLTSRVQFAGARVTSGQSLLMRVRDSSAPPRDSVEVLTFLTAPADVETDVGGDRRRTRAPAGVHAVLVPLRTGRSAATVSRQGRPVAMAALPAEVRDPVAVQDLQYHASAGYPAD